MNENYSKMRFTLDIMAEKIIGEYILQNEDLKEEIILGVKKGFENINIVQLLEEEIKKQITNAVKNSVQYGSIKQCIIDKTNKIVDSHIDKALEKIWNE